MTVHELIEALEQEDPNKDIHFAYNYGDHWNTKVAPKITSVGEEYIENSEYHRMPKIADEDKVDEWLYPNEEDEEDEEDVGPFTEVVVIS